ncbi:hypothetical protein ACFL5O_04380 [Myxococcota bacterium]
MRCLLLLLVALSVATPVLAATVVRTPSGTPVRWAGSSVVLQVTVPPARFGINQRALMRALGDAVMVWRDACEGCRLPEIHVVPAGKQQRKVRQDGQSIVRVQGGQWCPEHARDREECYARTRAAITHLYPHTEAGSERDGQLREVDLEINAVDFQWSLQGEVPGARPLTATLVHEVGHLFGLDHPCAAKGTSDAGAPLCSDAAVRHCVMYPDPTEPGRAVVLRPAADEVRALRELYPRRSWWQCGKQTPGPHARLAQQMSWVVVVVLGTLFVRRCRN